MENLLYLISDKKLNEFFANRFILMVENGSVSGKAISCNTQQPPSFSGVEKTIQDFLKEKTPSPVFLGFQQNIIKDAVDEQYLVFYRKMHEEGNQIGYCIYDAYRVKDGTEISNQTYYADGSLSFDFKAGEFSDTVHFADDQRKLKVIDLSSENTDQSQTVTTADTSSAEQEPDKATEASEMPPSSFAAAFESVAQTFQDASYGELLRTEANPDQSSKLSTIFYKDADGLEAMTLEQLKSGRRRLDLIICYRGIRELCATLIKGGHEGEDVKQALVKCLGEI